jgi:hypothetical protein
MKTKHTPAPLSVKPSNVWPFDIVTYDVDNNEVFRRRLPAYSTSDKTFKQALSGVSFDLSEQEQIKEMNHKALADEKLRAAAPELLDSILKIKKHYPTVWASLASFIKEDAEEAIRKATK